MGSIVAVVGLIFSFFVLWLSFSVQDNAWEFGVLRAMGIRIDQVIRLYIYEALVIVLSCIIIGTFVGTHMTCQPVIQMGRLT